MRMKELSFGVVGWGYWGPKIARNLDALPQGMVTMVADMDEYRLASLRISQPWMKATTRAEDVFRSEVDCVVIATPVRTHYRLAKEALLAGKHVLVEKPLTADIAEAEELVAIAQAQGRILMVGHTFEYSPAVNQLRKLVQSGDLGKIYCIDAERVNLGLFRSDIHVSWLHPCKIRRVTVIGDARMVVYDDTNPSEMIKIYNKGADIHADPVVSYRFGAITIPHIDWIEPLRLECEDFAHAIRTGDQPRAHGHIGLEVVRVLADVQEVLEVQERQYARAVV